MLINKDRRRMVVLALAAGIGVYTAPAPAGSPRAPFVQAMRETAACYGPPAAQAAPEPRVIRITASRFQFTPNRITLKKGQAVKLQLITTDRTHGFLLRPLKIDTDIKPGAATEITVIPRVAGTFRAICDHYCGPGHGNMKLTVAVQ